MTGGDKSLLAGVTGSNIGVLKRLHGGFNTLFNFLAFFVLFFLRAEAVLIQHSWNLKTEPGFLLG